MTETLAREDTEGSTSAQLWAGTSAAGETEAVRCLLAAGAACFS